MCDPTFRSVKSQSRAPAAPKVRMRSSLRFDVEQTGVVEPKLVVGAHTATIDRNATPATAAWMKRRRLTQSSVARRVGDRNPHSDADRHGELRIRADQLSGCLPTCPVARRDTLGVHLDSDKGADAMSTDPWDWRRWRCAAVRLRAGGSIDGERLFEERRERARALATPAAGADSRAFGAPARCGPAGR